MSYRAHYHRKRHAIRFGYLELVPGFGVAWDGGGIRPLDDVCGFSWVVDCLSANERLPKGLLVRGKDGWTLASCAGEPDYKWKRIPVFRGSPTDWSPPELAHYFLLAKRGLVKAQVIELKEE